MKITLNLLKAYNKTVANASVKGKSKFLCKDLNCDECPFKNCDCDDFNAETGVGTPRTVDEWREWFESLWADEQNEQNEQTEQNTSYNVSRTTLHVEASVERRGVSFKELLAELDEFKEDVIAWVCLMRRKASEISVVIPDYMEFYATDREGNSVIDWAMDAKDFGKKKVWIGA